MAEEKKVNYSRLLESALLEYLQLQQQINENTNNRFLQEAVTNITYKKCSSYLKKAFIIIS